MLQEAKGFIVLVALRIALAPLGAHDPADRSPT
jgi:hypothetical protein